MTVPGIFVIKESNDMRPWQRMLKVHLTWCDIAWHNGVIGRGGGHAWYRWHAVIRGRTLIYDTTNQYTTHMTDHNDVRIHNIRTVLVTLYLHRSIYILYSTYWVWCLILQPIKAKNGVKKRHDNGAWLSRASAWQIHFHTANEKVKKHIPGNFVSEIIKTKIPQ